MAARTGFYRRRGKRLFDLFLATTLLLLLSPLFALLTLSVLVFLSRPVFFCQQRPGRDGVPFQIYKFRTMVDMKDTQGKPLSDRQRLTPFGRFLRRWSLDELPELWNVLRGEMSLIGPRPLLMSYLERYSPRQARRHEALPGITGLAQVKGRNALTWEEKFELDVVYVDTTSLKLDLGILVTTLGSVLTGGGIAAEGYATMPEFQGNDDAREPKD